MKIRPLFDKYQKYLLAFANTKYGRMYLSLDKFAKIKNNYPIVKVAPDGIHWYLGKQKGKHYCQAVFFSNSPYLKKFRLALEGLELASSLVSKIHAPDMVIPHFAGLTHCSWLPLIMRADATFNPDADPETTSCDGNSIYSVGGGATWATNHDAANGTEAGASNTGEYCFAIDTDDTSNWFRSIYRAFWLFDTSSLDALTDEANIISGIFSLYGTGATDNATLNQKVSLVSSNPVSNTNIVVADYDQLGGTDYATEIDVGSWNTSGYNNYTLNETGIAAVPIDGITKFGTRSNSDRANSAPTWVSVVSTSTTAESSDNDGNKPKLVVTYTPIPGGGVSSMFFSGGLTIS